MDMSAATSSGHVCQVIVGFTSWNRIDCSEICLSEAQWLGSHLWRREPVWNMENLEISHDGHLKEEQKTVLLLMMGASHPSCTLSSLGDFPLFAQPQPRWTGNEWAGCPISWWEAPEFLKLSESWSSCNLPTAEYSLHRAGPRWPGGEKAACWCRSPGAAILHPMREQVNPLPTME